MTYFTKCVLGRPTFRRTTEYRFFVQTAKTKSELLKWKPFKFSRLQDCEVKNKVAGTKIQKKCTGAEERQKKN